MSVAGVGVMSEGSHLDLRVLNNTILLVGVEQVFTKSCSHDGSVALCQDMQVLCGVSG